MFEKWIQTKVRDGGHRSTIYQAGHESFETKNRVPSCDQDDPGGIVVRYRCNGFQDKSAESMFEWCGA